MADSARQKTCEASTTIYQPLDSSKSIRLPKVSPDKEDEVIRRKLIPIDLADSVRTGYIALSYEWRIHRDKTDPEHDGDTNEQVTIECDGEKIQIGRNLWDFLVEFRKADAWVESYLWVDAICINQSDDDERGQQVKLMGDVYSMAESVIAWLGEVADEDKLLFNDQESNFFTRQSRFLKRPYWYRVWIVQEVCLTRFLAIWYGPHRYDVTATRLDYGRFAYCPGLEVLEKRRKVRSPIDERDWTIDLRLGELVVNFKDWQCTELLDRVYGFIGIASQALGSSPGVNVDYNREPVDEVLVDVFKDYYASYREPSDRRKEGLFIWSIMKRLDVSHTTMKSHVLKNFPGLEAYEDLITEESLPVIASRLFTTGFLDFDPDGFYSNGDRWIRYKPNPFDERLQACEYFRRSCS